MKKIRGVLCCISAVDRALLVIMLILLAQTAYNLLTNEMQPEGAGVIDIIVRTSAAGIFGYYLSGNFIKKPRREAREKAESTEIFAASPQSDTPKNQIGFLAGSSAEALTRGSAEGEAPESDSGQSNNYQIFIVAAVGIFSLALLLVVRNHVTLTQIMDAPLSQLRDFVAGSVGFLISHGKNSLPPREK